MVLTLASTGPLGWALNFIFFIIFILFYSKFIFLAMMSKLERFVDELEEYSKDAQNAVIKKIGKNRKKRKIIKEKVLDFMDFFVSSPVDIDPYGILHKIQHIILNMENRIETFAEEVIKEGSDNEKTKITENELKDVKYGLIGAMIVTQIYKVVRHYVEVAKKTKNLQILVMLNMIIPEIMKTAKSSVKSTKAFLAEVPIGDGIGPLVAAKNKKKSGKEIEKDVVISEETIAGKKLYVMKAKGPGPEISQAHLWKGVEKIIKEKKIDYIITIDAVLKLEGEKTGRVAEGVGIAMSPYGVDRAFLEDLATKNNIKLDGIIVKMSDQEASIPMCKEIYKAIPKVQEKLENLIKKNKDKNILIIGVGNTCGIGNNFKEVSDEKMKKKLRKFWLKYAEEKRKEEEERKKWWKKIFSFDTFFIYKK